MLFPSHNHFNLNQVAYSATLADIRIIESEEKPPTMQKPKGLMKRMGFAIKNYINLLVLDYTTVAMAKDIAMDARQRPIKTISIGTAILGLVYTIRTNPNERALQSRLAELRQKMVMIPTAIHSTKADAALHHYTNLLNVHCLGFINFWFFTLLVERPYGIKDNHYEAINRTLRKWPWEEVRENCLDIGAFGRYWMLEKSFQDCDIREEEFIATNETISKSNVI